jgi:hypothetical protein
MRRVMVAWNVHQRADLINRLSALCKSLLVTTDGHTKAGIQKEIRALMIWPAALDAEPGKPPNER